ncbi:ABC transporter ATP-binding protein [Pantoea sp. B65]|uniref:ABC transporter ATP-binding protein n=1 Tax=Pantoea sp. B65 TaxID=2813359 RepID=UPI0039B409BA
MAQLDLSSITKRYGDFYATRNLSLSVEDGEFVALLGPSGCGKTTTMRMIAGFVEPTEGSVHIGGRDMTNLPPWKRDTGLVFQNYALFPHLSVAQNVAFGLEMRHISKSDIAPKVEEALRLVRLGGMGDRMPRQMSGGQQQRVALARALVFRPDVLLLDEPLSNLDAKLRLEVRVEIRELQRKMGITTVMVTHDQEEALTMADRLVVMRDGEVRQVGTQRDLYERPTDSFVASFVGRSSFLHGTARDAGQFLTRGGLQIQCAELEKVLFGPALLSLRPERIIVDSRPPEGLENVFPGEVSFVSYLGGLLDIHIQLAGDEQVIAQIPNRAEAGIPQIGDKVFVGWSAASARVFSDPDRSAS